MAVSPTVLAKARKPHTKIIVVTNSTSNIGKQVCEQAAASGATVYALDTDPAALAHLAIRFRQKNLLLRVVPCNLKKQLSIDGAIDEITDHSPPIDVWIHAEVLTPRNINHLSTILTTFTQYFSYHKNGSATFISDSNSDSQKTIAKHINDSPLAKVAGVLIATSLEDSHKIVDQLLYS